MPIYRVWYRENEEPLEFTTASRYSDEQILDHVLAHENITPSGDRAAPKDVIATNNLGRVRYTEDESEINTIG